MKHTPDTLADVDYFLYRVARFGATGRQGSGGVALAAAEHGVTVRAWFLYEAGKRRPKLEQRRRIAAWINRQRPPRPEKEPAPEVNREPEPPPLDGDPSA